MVGVGVTAALVLSMAQGATAQPQPTEPAKPKTGNRQQGHPGEGQGPRRPRRQATCSAAERSGGRPAVAGGPHCCSSRRPRHVPTSPRRGRCRSGGPRTPSAQRPTLAVENKSTSDRLGLAGLVFSVSGDAADLASQSVRVTVDYSAFGAGYGGDWASRLRLVPAACVRAGDPGEAGVPGRHPPCLGQRHGRRGTVGDGEACLAGEGADRPVIGGLRDDGQLGDDGPRRHRRCLGHGRQASRRRPSPRRARGPQVGRPGAFNWSMPVTLPPPPAGASPQIALSYSSAGVDGRKAATNNQPSWIGEGFELRHRLRRAAATKACADDHGWHRQQHRGRRVTTARARDNATMLDLGGKVDRASCKTTPPGPGTLKAE